MLRWRSLKALSLSSIPPRRLTGRSHYFLERKGVGLRHLEPPPTGATSGSLDHGKSSNHWGVDFGVVYTATLIPAPVTYANNPPKSSPISFKASDYVHHDRLAYLLANAALPNFVFPKFDGSNPIMWITNCETFFGVYDTDPIMWVRLAAMHLTGSVALWFQTMQATINAMNWDTFVKAVSNKFDRGEHNHLICHFSISSNCPLLMNMLSNLVI
jgi:hypothetical protein